MTHTLADLIAKIEAVPDAFSLSDTYAILASAVQNLSGGRLDNLGGRQLDDFKTFFDSYVSTLKKQRPTVTWGEYTAPSVRDVPRELQKFLVEFPPYAKLNLPTRLEEQESELADPIAAYAASQLGYVGAQLFHRRTVSKSHLQLLHRALPYERLIACDFGTESANSLQDRAYESVLDGSFGVGGSMAVRNK